MKFKRILSTVVSVALMATVAAGFTACSESGNSGGGNDVNAGDEGNNGGSSNGGSDNSGGSGNFDDGKTVKIGVLVADVSGDEALAFRAYYEDYIAKQYNVEFSYTDQLTDAAGERSAIEQFAAQGYDAVISLSSSDRAMQVETCTKNEIYYAVASGMLDDEQFEQYKDNKYFVGQVGPSMTTEYEAGLAMGEYYKNTVGVSSVAIYGAFIPNPMHVYRMAGLLTGLGLKYDGADGMAVVGSIFGDQGVTLSKISGDIEVKGYVQQFGDTTYDEIGAAVASSPDAFLSVGMATTFFNQVFSGAQIDYADIDSFTTANGEQMSQEGGQLKYLAGKYTSSIGPIFAAVYDAVKGAPIRDGGNAISVSQTYWVATSADEFAKFQSSDSATNPIFNKELLDTVIGEGVSFDTFKTLVETDRTPA